MSKPATQRPDGTAVPVVGGMGAVEDLIGDLPEGVSLTGDVDPTTLPLEKRPARYDRMGRLMCAGFTQAGEWCSQPAKSGMRMCRVHSQGNHGARKRARLRLLELVDPALATLAREMTNQRASPMARIRAAENILDRAGVARIARVETDDAKAMLAQRITELRGEAESALDAARAQMHVLEPVTDDHDDAEAAPLDPEENHDDARP